MSLKDKVPPHNDEAEQAALGAMLLDNDAIDTALQFIRPEDFYSNANRRVFQAILNLFNQGRQKADIITVVAELRQMGELDGAGGPSYVASLTDVVPTTANIDHYAMIVRDCSLRRSMLKVSAEISSKSFDESIEARTVIEEVQQKIFELSESGQIIHFKSARELINESVDQIERLHNNQGAYTGVPSGFSELDDKTLGFQKSELIVIGARPSIGKTALAISMAANITIRSKIPAAFFSLEMPNSSLILRLIAAEARLNSHKLRGGFFANSDKPRLYAAMNKISEAPLYLVDIPNMRMMDLRSQARRLRTQQKVEIIFVDYIGLISTDNRSIPRYEQFSEISRSLKSLARELEIPIIALSQLRREAEKDKPDLSSIRESGSIEQDADMVIFLHRERNSAAKKEEDRKSGKTELILAKQRNGPVGEILLSFVEEYAKYEAFAYDKQ